MILNSKDNVNDKYSLQNRVKCSDLTKSNIDFFVFNV